MDFYSCSVGSVAISPSSSTVGFSIKLTPPPPGEWGGAYLVQTFLRGGKLKTGGLFNLEKTIAPVFHKELEYKVQNLKNKKVGGHAESDPSWISPHKVLQS